MKYYAIGVLGTRLTNSIELVERMCTKNEFMTLYTKEKSDYLGTIFSIDYGEHDVLIDTVKECAYYYYDCWKEGSDEQRNKIPKWLKNYFDRGKVYPLRGMEQCMNTETYEDYIYSDKYNLYFVNYDFKSLDFKIMKQFDK